ncbi:MAG: hypothetical protein IJ232_03030, partial [Lachnospiraceae bacterium]|nr:hypothetical protein [Lachnospiraceae bacterium]
VDNDKIDLVVTKTLEGAPDDLDLSKVKFTVNVREVKNSAVQPHEYEATLQQIKERAEEGQIWYAYDEATNTFTWYFTNLETGSNATVTETIESGGETPTNISYVVTSNGTEVTSDKNYTSGSTITVDGMGVDNVIKTVDFKNTYSDSVEVIPSVYKRLDERTNGTIYPLDGLSFDFSIYALKDEAYPTDNALAVEDSVLKENNNWKTNALSTATASDGVNDNAAVFDKITIKLEGNSFPKYYYYKIVENDNSYSSIDKDTGYVIMEVAITKNASTGKLEHAVVYTKYNSDGSKDTTQSRGAEPKIFDNTTQNTGKDTSISISANKILRENNTTINTIATGQFKFNLEPVNYNGRIDDDNSAQTDVGNGGTNGRSISFDPLTYDLGDISLDSTNPTVYRYKISEVTDATNTVYTYDTNYYYVDVTVTRDTTGAVKAEISKISKYDSTDKEIISNVASNKIDFENTRSAREGSINIPARKYLDDAENVVKGNIYNKFNFYYMYIGEKSNSLDPKNISKDENPNGSRPVAGVLADDSDAITFGVEYSTLESSGKLGVGEHIYRLYERSADYDGISFTLDYYIVVVKVTESSDGTKLDTQISEVYYYKYNEETQTFAAAETKTASDIIFNNTTNKTSLSIRAQKSIANHDKDGFKFTLKCIDKPTTGSSYNVGDIYTATSGSDGYANFEALEFTKADIGTYKFEVREENGGDDTIIYDTHIYTLTVVVKEDTSTKGISAEITGSTRKDYDGASEVNYSISGTTVMFTNTVVPGEGSITFSAKKKLQKFGESTSASEITDLEGETLQFDFKLESYDVNTQATELIETVKNDRNGNVTFKPIKYTNADYDAEKVFYYKISEVAPTFDKAAAYDYSDDVYYVKVTLSKDETRNRIVANPTYYKGTFSGAQVSADDIV